MPPEQLRQVLIDLLDPKERKGSGGGAKGTDPEESGRNGKEVLNGILRGEIPIVASCGSGMTACVIWLALHELWAFMHPDRRAEINGGEDAGRMRIALYDEVRTSERASIPPLFFLFLRPNRTVLPSHP
ncbi:hypothetical protein FRC20_003234 [Serendipita sp. 405]|nr:hypothetical protein FRC20_003234 [Serendipita sp. 405]